MPSPTDIPRRPKTSETAGTAVGKGNCLHHVCHRHCYYNFVLANGPCCYIHTAVPFIYNSGHIAKSTVLTPEITLTHACNHPGGQPEATPPQSSHICHFRATRLLQEEAEGQDGEGQGGRRRRPTAGPAQLLLGRGGQRPGRQRGDRRPGQRGGQHERPANTAAQRGHSRHFKHSPTCQSTRNGFRHCE